MQMFNLEQLILIPILFDLKMMITLNIETIKPNM